MQMASRISTLHETEASRSTHAVSRDTDEVVEPTSSSSAFLGRSPAPHRRRGKLLWEKWLVKRLLRHLGDPQIGVGLWNGEEISPSQGEPVAVVNLGNRRTLLGLLANPSLEFGDALSDGRIEVDGDLLEFLQEVYRAAGTVVSPWAAGWLRGLYVNTIGRSRRNVHHHYDLGNDFYGLWLDKELVYTCAYFEDRRQTLEQAQRAKLDYVCRKLRLRVGESVVEAGFGWGALALHMARVYGVRVRAYNLSHEQTMYARHRAEAEDLASRVSFIEDDYRNISGTYDVFVSVGMLEHVGRRRYQQLGEVINRCLKSDGRGLVHSIGRNRPAPIDAWIGRRIFPGAYPPTLQEMMDVFQPWEFSVLDVENLRLHYARTLEHWLERFESHQDQVVSMFDPRFVRMWRLYLTGSIAAFQAGMLQLYQILFARPGVNSLPWTRAALYRDP
jgi:cyclopropane-fatty-acyl-phospholipid synthase